MPITNQVYDSLKWVALVALPALGVFITQVGQLYTWAPTDQVVQVIQMVAVFLGSLLQVSSYYYHRDDNFSGGSPAIS